MNVLPYIPQSVRSKEFWRKVSFLLNTHPVIARISRLESVMVKTDDWFKMVVDGKILPPPNPFTEEELDAAEERWSDESPLKDFVDVLHYRRKEVIEIGDRIVWVAPTDSFAKGSLYKVCELNDEDLSGFVATVENDNGERESINHLGVKSIWRDSKEVWNLHREYFKLFTEQKPGHPSTEKLRAMCEERAILDTKGEE